MRAATRHVLYALFAASGFCGLIYESIWSHYLKNYLGHAAHGQTVVLVIFVGGLALGAWLAGRYTARLRDPLIAYAAAELFVGLFAFAFHPLYVAFTGWAYESLLPSVCGVSTWCATQWLTAALLIALPATALGATFPWMAAGVLRRYPESPGHEISVLYFVNSLGAVAGVLASAFLFIPAFGLPGTVQLAGALNILVGIAVAIVAWRPRPASAEIAPEPVVEAPARRKAAKRKADAAASSAASQPPMKESPARWSLVATMLAVAALTGLASFVYEIVWLRMLALVLGASTQAFELMLAAFILGLALGGAWIRNRIDRIEDIVGFLGGVQVWMAVAAVVTLPLFGYFLDALVYYVTALARNDRGYVLLQAGSAAMAMAVMLPTTFLAGMTLPLITYRMLKAGVGEGAIGNVYAANTVGAILGVIVAVHLLLPLAGLKGALLAGAAVDLMVGAYLLWRPRERAFTWPGFATVTSGLLVLGIVTVAVQPDPRRLNSSAYRGSAGLSDVEKVVFHADGKAATVTVIEAPDRRMLATNGKIDATVALPGRPPTKDEPSQLLVGAYAVGAQTNAKRAAVIGMGSGMTTAALLAWPTIERVDTIEIEPRVVDAARMLGEANAVVFRDPRSRFVYDDAKAWLARAEVPWDVIVSEPSHPWVSGVASLFTEEMYARVSRKLAPGGVFVQWIQLYDTNGALMSSIFRALITQFPHYAVYLGSEGDLMVVAARDRRPVVDAARLFASPGMATLLRAAGIAAPADIEGRWRGDDGTINALMAAYDVPPNSDFRPYVDVNAPRARFVGADLLGMFHAPLVPAVPIDVLGATRPRDERSVALAEALAAAVEASPEVTVPLPPAYASYAGAIRASRELLRTCKVGGPPVVLLEGAIGTAILINLHLDKTRAAQAWQTVRDGPCYRTLAPDVQRWVDLFAAVAVRDTAAMADLGTRLVATAPNAFARDYALAVAVVGELAQSRHERARQLLDQYPAKEGALWMLPLREMAGQRSIRAAVP